MKQAKQIHRQNKEPNNTSTRKKVNKTIYKHKRITNRQTTQKQHK